MRSRKPAEAAPTNFERTPELTLEDGKVIVKGDIIKIRGQYGGKFKFDSLTVNKLTGSKWVDCFETYRGGPGPLRSFKIEDVKRIPKKRGRK